MNSPLNTDQFALWPPTPRNHSDMPTTSGPEHYMYSTAESIHQETNSPWDPVLLAHDDLHSPPPITDGGLPTSHCGSSVEGELQKMFETWSKTDTVLGDSDWSRPRSDYGSMLDVNGHELSSSYESSNGGLFPQYFGSQPPMHGHSLSLDTNIPRRISDAASLSSGDLGSSASTDYTRYDDLSAYGDGTLMPDYGPRNAWSTTTTPLSPVLGPAQRFSRSTSRSRGSPSPSRASSYRTAPYDKTKRWSTGNSYSTSHLSNVDPALRRPAAHSYNSSPIVQTLQTVMPSSCGSPYLPSQIPLHQPTALYLPGPHHDPYGHDAHMMAQGLCLPSHPHDYGMAPYAEYSDPPNLYGALNEEQIPPPPEDMNPEDPDMKPHEQDLRFDGDLYTPRWVRGHGNKREGWCGICKPGRWLVLKNSAFWYDKSFTHGISAATGMPFHEPRDMRRMDGNPDVWEGLCHSCSDWVPLVSNKKKGTTWFRHAYRVSFLPHLFIS